MNGTISSSRDREGGTESAASSGQRIRRRRWTSLAVLVVVFAVYRESRVVNSFDSLWSIHLALSLVRSGDLDLEEYRAAIPPDDYRVTEVDDRLRSVFPLGAPLLAAPLVAVAEAVRPASRPDLYAELARGTEAGTRRARRLEETIASLLVALAAVAVFAIGRRHLDTAGALALTAVFAFGTSAWSLASRGLWQHGPSMLLLAFALYLFLLGDERPRAVGLAGLALALAFVVRPTNAVALLVFALLVAARHPRWLPAFALWATAVLVPLVLYDFAVYGSPLPPYYAPTHLGEHDLLQALAANLVSPARGLFVFSPVLLFAGWGAWLKLRAGRWTALDSAAAAVLVAHWGVVSAFPHWWAGHCYGPRFMSDVVPFFVYFTTPALAALRRPAGWKRWTLGVLFALAFAVSFAIHARGANALATARWNSAPVDVDERPERVWGWSDPPFLRGIG